MSQSTYQPRLKVSYKTTIASDLQKQFGLSNIHEVPGLQKIIVSIGLGKGKDDKKLFEVANNTLRKITGQQPVRTLARKSIASFKLREGNPIGMKVTLRGDRMYEFLDRLVTIVLPRLRDFHGVSAKAFDREGNYSLGIEEQSIFNELSFDETTTTHGLQITLVINGKNIEHNQALLAALGMPFEKGKES